MRVAIFTMVYNEALFLPAWISHYSHQFGRENLFVIDVGSSDNSTSNLGVSSLRVPRSPLEEEVRTRFVQSFHSSLLSYYDVVIFCDTDEFFVADPDRYHNLVDMLEQRSEQVLAGIGLNVLHMTSDEGDLLADVPLLEQRRYVQFDSLYCKPVIGRRNIQWTPGFHSCRGEYTLCSDLYLFHLKAVDRRIFFQELHVKRQAGLSEEAVRKGHGVQLFMQTEDLTRIYFPVSSANYAKDVSDRFDFRNDVNRYIQGGFQGLHGSRGAIARVPERFRQLLPSLSF